MHELAISIIKCKHTYWWNIRRLTSKDNHTEAWEVANDTIKMLERSIEVLKQAE